MRLRKSLPFLRGEVLILFLISFVVNLGFSCVSPVFPFYVLALKGLIHKVPELELTVHAEQASIEFGVLMASFMLTRAPMAAVSGHLSDVLGRKRMISLGLLVYSLAAAAYLFCPSVAYLIAIRASQGVASAMVWPVAEALLSDLVKKSERGRAMSIYISLMNFATVFGPSMGAITYKLYVSSVSNPDLFTALRTPFILLTATSFVGLASSFKLSETKVSGGSRGERSADVRASIRRLKGEIKRSLNTMYINGMINGFSMGIIQTAFIIFVITEVSKDPSIIALLFSVSGALTILSSIVAGHVSDKVRKRKTPILLSYLVSRPVFFFAPLVRDVGTLLVFLSLWSLASGISIPLMRALQADLVSSKVRGTIFGFQQTFFNSGIIVGALAGGYLCETLAGKEFSLLWATFNGLAVPFFIAASLGVVTTILFGLYVTEKTE
ncbi:MFS transporter [Candidatus Bathyarchaeota archaeon]|nr:MFS transporter [Candidatus Bathyarchaeota archaeon]